MRIAICDDLKIHIEKLQRMIESYSFKESVQLDTFLSGREMLHSLNEQIKYDIIFMDIHLGEGEQDTNGMVIATAIKRIYPQTLLIYVSSYDWYDSAMVNAEPFMFLQKPLAEKMVHGALDNAIKRLQMTVCKYYYFMCNRGPQKVDLNEVLYIESAYKRVMIKAKTGECSFYGKTIDQVFTEVERIYPYFIRANKSIIFNFLHVVKMQRTEIHIGGEKISIGRKYEKEYMEKTSVIIQSISMLNI